MNMTEDPITVAPTITGSFGKAWLVDVDACCERTNRIREECTIVAMWLIEAAWAHPLWHSYWLNLVHLRPRPLRDEETKFYLPGATHELCLFALNPDKPREDLLQTGMAYRLIPINFAAQIIEPSDATAAARAQTAVEMVCDGKLSPDTDFIQQWVRLFGDNMLLS